MRAGSIVLLGRVLEAQALGPQRPAVRRAPLPPNPRPVDYAQTLPFTPPPGRALGFYRGQFCGLRIADAPAVPGSNDRNPSCIMAALLDNYPPAIQDEFLEAYAAAGYTHLQRSIGHALHYSGGNLDAYVALSRRARGTFGLYCDHWFLAGEDVWPGGQFQTVDYWRAIFDPILPRLLQAGIVDLACVGWQLDAYNVPGNQLIAIIQYFAQALPREIPLFTHWINHSLAWWKKVGERPDGSDIGEVWTDQYQTIEVRDRFTWWQAMQPYLSGGHHQGSTRMALKEYQDRICDTLDYFGGDTSKGSMGQSRRTGTPQPFQLTGWEVSGQDQFDDVPSNPHRISEIEGDQRGYLVTCTTSPWAHLAGYGNGARRPDGSAL